MILGIAFTIAAYGVYAGFWIRFFAHLLVWWRATRHAPPEPATELGSRVLPSLLLVRDVVFFWRLLSVNPALWLGEWVFHVSFVLVILRHLRYFLDPVPGWVWDFQLPGLLAGYILPFALLYVMAVRLFTKQEKYSSPENMFLLILLLAISTIGLTMRWLHTPNLVEVKFFAFGIVTASPAAFPEGALFLLHFSLVLVFVLFVPSHIVAAPFVMYEARKRDLGLKTVMHDNDIF